MGAAPFFACGKNRYMSTWRTASFPSAAEATLIREGLLIPYTADHAAPADLAATPPLRGALISPLLPAGATAVGLTACWIHTGWWPSSRFPALTAGHPYRSDPCIRTRTVIPQEHITHIGGCPVTLPARTAADLLLLEPTDIALSGLFMLAEPPDRPAFFSDLTRILASMHRRPRLPRARAIVQALSDAARD